MNWKAEMHEYSIWIKMEWFFCLWWIFFDILFGKVWENMVFWGFFIFCVIFPCTKKVWYDFFLHKKLFIQSTLLYMPLSLIRALWNSLIYAKFFRSLWSHIRESRLYIFDHWKLFIHIFWKKLLIPDVREKN